MRVVLFYHSLVSDWNHGNAHFLRGIATELRARGHELAIYEPEEGWSRRNLLKGYGEAALGRFAAAYPGLRSQCYPELGFDLEAALSGADLVLVHEWNSPELVRRIGMLRARTRGFRLLFHDTHHRAVSDPEAISAFDLRDYDGVLAFGAVLRELYLARCWTQRAWTWHEAADTRVFRPQEGQAEADLVFIGNFGDGERTAELNEFLVEPIETLQLRAAAFGVRYPEEARQRLAQAGIAYGGFLPNYEAPRTFARFRATVHVPRRQYAQTLRGVPTIRVFEALACAIPLACAPWDDSEGLFTPGKDYVVAEDGAAMARQLRALIHDRALAAEIAASGLAAIRARHTCAHRVDELLRIHAQLQEAA